MSGKNAVSKQHQQGASDDEESEGLAFLIPDIQETARIANLAISKVLDRSGELCFNPLNTHSTKTQLHAVAVFQDFLT
jgi:hypothetical protein